MTLTVASHIGQSVPSAAKVLRPQSYDDDPIRALHVRTRRLLPQVQGAGSPGLEKRRLSQSDPTKQTDRRRPGHFDHLIRHRSRQLQVFLDPHRPQR